MSNMNVGRLRIVCWKTLWKLLSLIALFSILCNLIQTQEYNIERSDAAYAIVSRSVQDIKIEKALNATTNAKPTIPFIIHQTWDNIKIPGQVSCGHVSDLDYILVYEFIQ